MKIKKLKKYWGELDLRYTSMASFWLISGKAVLLLLSFIMLYVLSNELTRDQLGYYQYIIAVASIIALLSLPGLNTSLIQAVAKGYDGTIKKIFRTRLIYGVISTIIFLFISIWYTWNNEPTLAICFLIISILSPLKESVIGFWSYWTGRELFLKQVSHQIITNSATTVATIVAIFLTHNVIIVIAVFFLSQVIVGFYLYYKILKQIRNNETNENVLSFGKHLTIMQVFMVLANHIDKVVLWKILGPIAVAEFYIASEPFNKARQSLPLKYIFLPKFSRIGVLNQTQQIWFKFFLLLIISIFISIIFWHSTDIIYNTFFPKYLESSYYFKLLSLSFITTPATLLYSALSAEMDTKSLYYINIVPTLIKLLSVIPLVYIFGILGAVFSTLIYLFLRSLSIVASFFYLTI